MTLRGLFRIVLILAVALCSGLLFRGLFIASTAAPPPPKPVAVGAVATAARPLPKGLLLREDDFGWREIPQDQVTPTMIAKGSPNARRLPGAVVRQPIEDGADLTPRDIVFPDAPGFLAAALAPGMRAVSVAIDDVTGNAGLILPGDRVDLLLTQRLENTGPQAAAKVASEIVLSDLRVIAVGSQMKAPESDGAQPRPARTVTLEVTPDQAERVSVATRLGQLSLALRSLASPRLDPAPGAAGAAPAPAMPAPLAVESEPAQPTWGEDVSMAIRMQAERRPAPAPAHAAAPARRGVQVYRGSSRPENSAGPGGLAGGTESGPVDSAAFAAAASAMPR
ncbi:Flp pilus assembly protein CpaB [Phaeospirillum tilakii]|uniref:Flp pilus assembly protein CpaB n=1 Tax=Phaeospirillum tilakii TaxID=741673 RepID=A0ABW5CCE4_9PROT